MSRPWCRECLAYSLRWPEGWPQGPRNRADGRDGLCKDCRAEARYNAWVHRQRWRAGGAHAPAWVGNWRTERGSRAWMAFDLEAPKSTRPAARWRAKTRRSKHRRG